jgi:UPF0755 protein
METSMSEPISLNKAEVIKVVSGDSLKSIANKLVADGFIAQPYYFMYEARRNNQADKLQVGEYEVAPGDSPRDLLAKLVTGKVIQYSLTLVEGWNFLQILSAIKINPVISQTLDAADPSSVMANLGYSDIHPEGNFFPDTYHFPSGTTDVEFLKRAYESMQQVLKEEWQHRATGLPYTKPYEALIMASIIEKETGVEHERGEISGVFVRRLEKNMLLQTDPTVIYAMGPDFDGNIRRKDLAFDSPYNTYRYKGLPPTPIASPGRAAIQAALHPESGTSLYFVAKGDGSHYFSDSLDEHNQAVRRYQLNK